jgi:hypothetical protein
VAQAWSVAELLRAWILTEPTTGLNPALGAAATRSPAR